MTTDTIQRECTGLPGAVGSADPGRVTGRERFLAACEGRRLDRPPVWLMRQAGRALPEYRELKEKHSFVELVRSPELAAEVTLQPMRRFGFDAAVLFSDILVIAEALGQAYRFREGGGVELAFAVRTEADVDRLEVGRVREHLGYVARALGLVRDELKGRTAVLGFAGSPWTLANFMMQGGSAPEYLRAKQLFYTERRLFDRLLATLTDAVATHLKLQIEAGADAVQIFDSLGGLLAAEDYAAASARWMAEVIRRVGTQVPVILYVRGRHGPWDTLIETGAQVLSVDWRVSLPWVRAALPERMAVQGNLDPFLLTTAPEIVVSATQRLLESMRDRPGHIVNLGHGLPPMARLECIEALVQTVREFA